MLDIPPDDRRQSRIAFMVVVVALLVGLALLLLSQAHFRELEALIERDPPASIDVAPR